MPRAKAILQSEFPYHITARCINREWFSLPMTNVWEIFCEELRAVHEKHNLRIHVFVLMSNHYHLIASTPHANVSKCMHQFMQRSSLKLTRAGNRINETFAGRHYKTILHEPNYFLAAYKYNYRNPVEAGLCTRVEDYPFSTLPAVMGTSRTQFPIVPDYTFLSDPSGTLEWLNTSPSREKYEAVKYALSRQYFKSRKDPLSRQHTFGEDEIL